MWWWLWWWCGPGVTEVSLSIPLHGCTKLWESCPCGHDPRPCAYAQGPNKSTPPRAAVPPSAAQECPESGPWAQRRRTAPWCASGPVPAAPAAHPDRVAGNPGEEGASVAVALRTCPCAPPLRPCPSSVLLRACLYSDRAIATL